MGLFTDRLFVLALQDWKFFHIFHKRFGRSRDITKIRRPIPRSRRSGDICVLFLHKRLSGYVSQRGPLFSRLLRHLRDVFVQNFQSLRHGQMIGQVVEVALIFLLFDDE